MSPVFPSQGGSDGTWGTEYSDFISVFAQVATGNLRIVSYENETVYWENEVITDVDHQFR